LAFIESHFTEAGTKPAKGGKVLPVLSCKICKGQMKKGRRLERQTDGKVTKHNNGSLKRHLQNHGVRFGDQDEKEDEEQQQQQQQQQQQRRRAKDEPGQTKITQFTKMSPEMEEELTQAIVLMCALDNRPFNVVQGKGFKYLMTKATQHRFSVPSRTTVADRCKTMAKQAREVTRNRIKEDVDDGATFTMSFDAWKDRCVCVLACSDVERA